MSIKARLFLGYIHKEMKKVCIAVLLLFGAVCLKAQSLTDCENVVKETVNAVNSYSSEALRPYLASDFECSGQKGDVASLVLNAIFGKLEQSNDSIAEYKKVSDRHGGNTLTLVYSFTYSKLGERTTTFVFNDENKIKSLELLKATVKQADKGFKFEKPQAKVITIPITLTKNNMIATQAAINGEKHNFIIDSGCSILYLNSKYFRGNDDEEGARMSSSEDVNGKISGGQDVITVDSFDFNGIRANGIKVMASDLSHLEKGTDVYGLIGYDVYKDYDLMFDYKKKTLTLIDPDYTETFLKERKYEYDEVPFEMSKTMRHIPLIKAQIDTASLTFGIDCGAGNNLIDSKRWDEFESMLRRVKTTKLKGISNDEGSEVHVGKLKSLKIGGKTFRHTQTVFNNISHFNRNKDERIDGLIGYEVLSKQKAILSYKNKKLIFIK